jgi:hypothetical protein
MNFECRVKAVNNFRVPENPTEVKSFLGLVNFCAKYICDFATLAEPLRKLTRKEVKWQVNTGHQTFVPIQAFMTHECGDKS